MSNFKYRPEIDGLRAISVISVILFHAGLGCSGGYVGVDVFFVISGYLITGIIQSSIEKQKFSLMYFWARRVCRILPASIAMTVTVVLAGLVILLPYDMHELAEASFAHMAVLSNFYHLHQLNDYFAAEASLRPLLHTWSLAVEEQFYLVCPLALFFMRNAKPRLRIIIFSAAALVSLISSEMAAHLYPQANFFMLPTRAWELLAGSLIAIWPRPLVYSRWVGEAISSIGLGFILAAIFFYDDGTQFPGITAVLPVVGAVLSIVGCGNKQVVVRKLLSLRPVVFIGLISYSLYLWHWPILVFARYAMGEELGLQVIAGALVLTFVMSVISWRFIEMPFRKGIKFPPKRLVLSGAFSSFVVGAVSLPMVLMGGLPARFVGNPLVMEDAGFHNSHYFSTADEAILGEFPLVGCQSGRCPPPRFLLWGDSHAPAIADLLDDLASKAGISGYVAVKSATPPIVNTGGEQSEASRWNSAVVDYVEREGIANVIIVSRWSTWLTDEASLARARERLLELNEMGVRIWIMQQVPEQSFNVSRALYFSQLGFPEPVRSTLVKHTKQQEKTNDLLHDLRLENVVYLDPKPLCFDKQGVSILGNGLRSFYRDDDHLSSYGAKVLLTPLYHGVMEQIELEYTKNKRIPYKFQGNRQSRKNMQ